MAKILRLKVYPKWFEMIKSGEKKEDYREINLEWIKKLLILPEDFHISDFYVNNGNHGYSYLTNSPEMLLEIYKPIKYKKYIFINTKNKKQLYVKPKKLIIGRGKLEWGADKYKYKKYFVLRLGEVLNEKKKK